MMSVTLHGVEMPHNRAIVPNYDSDDEHIVRRLGAAVVALWGNLDHATQARLLSQATLMHMRTPEQKSLIEAAGWSGCAGVKIRQR
jgi:hypothetical protein